MTFRAALRLGRVSNLPTVTTNVLAATVLAGGTPGTRTAFLCCAMSMMYVAGMYLNDAFDREIDAVERPDRPIPSGEIGATTVFATGFGLLGGGLLLVAWSTAGASPIVAATALAALIIYYDANHKHNSLAPLVMGLCRAAVYTTAALAVAPSLPRAVLVATASLLAYLIGLTFIARAENLRELRFTWPLAFLAVPVLASLPRGVFASAIYAGFVLWILWALALVRARAIRRAVTSLIAGISILDAVAIASTDHPGLAVVALAAFFTTLTLQRAVPGT